MCFRELKIKSSYRSLSDNIANDFFNIVLPDTNLYLRAAGYYSSTSLKIISYGLSSMFWKNGKMKLLISPDISAGDLGAIEEGKISPEEIINKIFLQDQKELEELMASDNIKALAYLVANGSLQIKFVIPISNFGLFHMKFGIMYDEDGDMLGFSGSLNESQAGFQDNLEEFKVFRSFEEGQLEFIQSDLTYFNDIFENKGNFGNFHVVDLPDESKGRLIKAYNRATNNGRKPLLPPLRDYQKNAINTFEANGMKGIIEMATGTGKTRVALEIIKLLAVKSKKPLLVLIAVPVTILVKQWERELGKMFDFAALVLWSSSRSTLDDLYLLTHKNNLSGNSLVCCICTYDYAASEGFFKIVESASNFDIVLVADEVHRIGAKSYSILMNEGFKYRLGLSATPERLFDEEGNEKISSYFGGTVFQYKIKEAIEAGYLTEFKYHPIFVPLLEDEMRNYVDLSKKISKYSRNRDEDFTENKQLNILMNNRAKIIKKAANKADYFSEMAQNLRNEGKFHDALAFFEDKSQISEYTPIFLRLGIDFRILSGDEPISEREKILSKFRSGKIECIASMKVLDEGIDLTNASTAFLLASTTNPRQYIQRCGRILRGNSHKDYADIFDLIVCPPDDTPSCDAHYAKGILEKEFKRAWYFALNSSNKSECWPILLGMARKFNVPIINELL